MSDTTTLGDDMRGRADKDNLPAAHPMRLLADAFDVAAYGYAAKEQTHTVKQFMGAWARARKCWSEYTGEPLI